MINTANAEREKLFVPMIIGPAGVVGEVRRHGVSDPAFPYDIHIPSGIMEVPAYFTFGRTNPATLAYEE